MWLLIPQGFYSIVQKEGEEQLCVRARVRADPDRLRETHLPTLGETAETPGGDYRYRAWISRDDLAAGMAEIVRNLDYANFKERCAWPSVANPRRPIGRAQSQGPRVRPTPPLFRLAEPRRTRSSVPRLHGLTP